jgi:hypothetical protein
VQLQDGSSSSNSDVATMQQVRLGARMQLSSWMGAALKQQQQQQQQIDSAFGAELG